MLHPLRRLNDWASAQSFESKEQYLRYRGWERGELDEWDCQPPAPFDPAARGLLYDREASVWYPTTERPCLYPTVQVENGHIGPMPADWQAGTLIAGDKDTGKSSVMLRQYLNAIQDGRGAVILIDPKRTLALRALALTPQLCGKNVWYLDLSRPAFGMSPMRMGATKQAIAGVLVAALRDVFPDQLFQASREVIEKCTLAALALAATEERPARIEDVFNLMVWENEGLRARAVQACSRIPNGDRVRNYFTVELAGEMLHNTSSARERLRAPRNKLDGLLTAPSLRIFFNHIAEKPLEEIVADRDILIVDANLGDGGGENSELMVAVILHMLDSVLTRQQGLPADQISKVHLFIDEGGHVLNQHTMKMQDSHRESGFTLTVAMHYMDQLDLDVLAGVLNMLANKYIFRIGRHKDAKELCDDIRDTVYDKLGTDKTAVWPEALQNLRNLRCVGTWLNDGVPGAPFLGRPYPMPPVSVPGWRPHWLKWLENQVGEYPEHILWTLRDEPQRETVLAQDGGNGRVREAEAKHGANGAEAQPANGEKPTEAGRPVARLDDVQRLTRAAKLSVSPARLELAAFSSLGIDPETVKVPAPKAIEELHRIEQLKYRTREPLEDERSEPLPRLNDNDMSALAALDRLGFLAGEQLGRCSWPATELNNVQKRLRKLASAGLVHRYPLQLEGQRGGRSTYLYALSPKGLYVGQHPPQGRRPSISERREYRTSEAIDGRDLRHDLGAASWLISFLRAFPSVTADNWRTPRSHSGHLDVPTVGAGRRGERREMTMFDAERALDESCCFVDVKPPQKIVPDLSIELRLPHGDRLITTDLLVEVDNTGKPEHNAPKFRAYDSLLCGWCLSLPRYEKLATRPFCLFVCPDQNAIRVLMRRADSEMTGGVGVKGMSDPDKWYYAGRDHIAFTTMELIHYGLPTAWMLPSYPPKMRAQLGDRDGYRARPVSLLAPSLIASEAMVGWELRGGRAVELKERG